MEPSFEKMMSPSMANASLKLLISTASLPPSAKLPVYAGNRFTFRLWRWEIVIHLPFSIRDYVAAEAAATARLEAKRAALLAKLNDPSRRGRQWPLHVDTEPVPALPLDGLKPVGRWVAKDPLWPDQIPPASLRTLSAEVPGRAAQPLRSGQKAP